MDFIVRSILADSEVDPGFIDAEDMNRIYQNPLARYTMQFLEHSKPLKKANVTKYRDYVLSKGPAIDIPDLPKCNRKAAEVRNAGNRLYLNQQFKKALEKYNESICWAENNSEELAMCYANRSAVYFEQEEYQYALANIALAKENNYPQRFMPKLLDRRTKCLVKINNSEGLDTVPQVRLAFNVDVNRKIPHLAKGIRMEVLPTYGRSLVVERDFKAGDVILQEKSMMASISTELKYLNCNYCSIENFHSLLPCPDCVSVMYCSEQCRQKARKAGHRFECGIAEKLLHISHGTSRFYMGPRMFFYGLSLFNDDLDEMMAFASQQSDSGNANPLSLDYKNYDALEEFKIFHQVKLPVKKFRYENLFRFYSAIYYSIYIKHPLVKSILTNRSKKNFMLKYFLDYMRIVGFLIIGTPEQWTIQLQSLASVCNHSCDPNTMVTYFSGQLKFVVIRPITKGEQVFVSYGPLFGKHEEDEREEMMEIFYFVCNCSACDITKIDAWLASSMLCPPIPRKHIDVLRKTLRKDDIPEAAKMNAIQQFVKRHAARHPEDDFLSALHMYRQMLYVTHMMEIKAQLRANIVLPVQSGTEEEGSSE